MKSLKSFIFLKAIGFKISIYWFSFLQEIIYAITTATLVNFVQCVGYQAAENVTIMDKHLALLGKERSLIKADGYCLSRAIYTGMKKKQLLPSKHSYKYLSRKAVLYIVSFDKYNDFIIDTELEIVYQYSNMRKKGIQLKKSRCSFGSID